MKKIIFILVFLFFIFLCWFIFFSPLFQIKKFEIVPEEKSIEVKKNFPKKTILGFIDLTKNIIFFNQDQVKKFISPEIKKIEIKKDYFQRKVKIIFKKRKRILTWCFLKGDEKKCFLADEEGIIFKESSYPIGLKEIIVNDASQRNFSLLEKVISPKNILSLKEIFDHFSSFEKKEFIYPGPEFKEITLILENKLKIFFDLRKEIDHQLEVLDKFLANKNINELKYIDLRSLPKIYYQ